MIDFLGAKRAHAVAAVLLMAASAIAATWLMPRTLLADQRAERVDIERAVPTAFGDWQIDNTMTGGIVNPQTKEALDRIYDQLLSRVYVNRAGQRIMLSIAYGADQRRRIGLQLHQPEICYPAQGFEIGEKSYAMLQIGSKGLPVRRLETSLQRQRFEPITYWLMTGEFANDGGSSRRKINLHYSLKRTVPDGLLFRVSSIGPDAQHEFALQERFVNELIINATPNARRLLAGL